MFVVWLQRSGHCPDYFLHIQCTVAGLAVAAAGRGIFTQNFLVAGSQGGAGLSADGNRC